MQHLFRSAAAALLIVVLCASCGENGDPDSRTLGALADERGFRVGTFLFSAAGPSGDDQQAFQQALHEFNLYILPVFPNFVEPEKDRYDFTLPDAVADAAPPGTAFYVPAVIWNDNQPDWLRTGSYSGEELRPILVDLVTQVMEHYTTKYPERAIVFEIVLEPMSWQGIGGFWHKIGLEAGLDQYEYIRLALRTARAVAPSTTLYLDDFGVEDLGPRSDAYLALVSQLINEGVPLDGIGFEGHFMLEPGGAFATVPSGETLTASLRRFGDLGLETMITSVDVAIRDADVNAATLDQQAQAYRRIVHACLSESSCRAFATWGLGDTDSWILQYFPGWGSPLLFDAHYARKPAYSAVLTELQ